MATAQLNPAPTAVKVPRKKVTHNANPLLVPTETGKSRAPTCKLPPDDHVYGKVVGRDEEGAKEVIMTWKEHTKNAASMPGRDFKALNKNSVRAGNVTSKDMTEYRKVHDFRLKSGEEKANQLKSGMTEIDPLFAFGKKTRPGTPMEVVLTNTFQNEFVEKMEIVKQQYARQENRSIAVLHTKASLGHAKHPEAASETKEPFKLKKFQNASPKIVQADLPGA